MNPEKLRHHSRYLSWLLRHGAIESGLSMDTAGWAAIEDVLRIGRLSAEALDEVVARNNKSRLQVDGDRIRASQGHSTSGTPVTLEGLESSWQVWESSTSLWHGTQPRLVESIARAGLLPQSRTHVHLAEHIGSRVGKRSGVGVVLEISPAAVRSAGQTIFRSPNGVILIRHVPASAIVALQPLTRRARNNASRLRSALGL